MASDVLKNRQSISSLMTNSGNINEFLPELVDWLVHGRAQTTDLGDVLAKNIDETSRLVNTQIMSGPFMGMLLLHTASLYDIGHDETAKLIVELTGDVNFQVPAGDNHLGGAPLHLCASSHNCSMATHIMMLRTDAIIDLRDSQGLTPIHRAVLAGCGSIARMVLRRYPELIDQTVTPDSQAAGNLAGMNYLHLAVVAALNNPREQRESLYHLVDFLVRQGCDVNGRDTGGGGTPIHFAAARGVNDLLYLMLNSRDVMDSIDDSAGLNALHCAALSNELIAINMLLMRSFDVNGRGARGETPLMAAAMANSCEAIRLLVDNGADGKLADETGATALHYAAATAATDAIFEILHLTDLHINTVDNLGGTALHTLALRYASLPTETAMKACQILIDFTIDANISDHFGNRAFKYLPEDDKEAQALFGRSHLYSYDNFHDRELEYDDQVRLPVGLPRLPVSQNWLEEMVQAYGPAAQDEYQRDFEKRLYYFPGEPRRTPPLEREPDWWPSELTFPYTKENKVIADREDIGLRVPAVVIPLGPDPYLEKFDRIAPELNEYGELVLKPWMRKDDRSREYPTRLRPDRLQIEEYNPALLKRANEDEVLAEVAVVEQEELDAQAEDRWWKRKEPRIGIDRQPTDYRPYYFPGQAKDEIILQPDIEFPAELDQIDKYLADEGDPQIINKISDEFARPPTANEQTAEIRRPPTASRAPRTPDPQETGRFATTDQGGAPYQLPPAADGRNSAATSSIVGSSLGSSGSPGPNGQRTPRPTKIGMEHQIAADQEQEVYYKQLRDARPLRYRVFPSNSRNEYYQAHQHALGNFMNDSGYAFHDRNIMEGRRKASRHQIARPPSQSGYHARNATDRKYGRPVSERGIVDSELLKQQQQQQAENKN